MGLDRLVANCIERVVGTRATSKSWLALGLSAPSRPVCAGRLQLGLDFLDGRQRNAVLVIELRVAAESELHEERIGAADLAT